VVTRPPASAETWVVPELGPSLGRLSDPPSTPDHSGALGVVLEDIRLELVSGIFDMAGAARSFMAAGDHQAPIASLARVATEAGDPETLKRQGSLSLSPIDDLE